MHVLCACMCVCVQEYSLSKCWCMQVVSSLHELPSVLKGPLGSSAVGLFVEEYEEQETERVQCNAVCVHTLWLQQNTIADTCCVPE